MRSAFTTAIALLLGIGGAFSQPTGPAYTVTYIEVAPAQAEEALGLLRGHAAATRADAASAGFDLLRRIDRPHHFAIVERWRNAAAADAHRAGERVAAFRAALAPTLIAPYDERPHTTLAIGAVASGALYVVTHVDVVPPQRENGAARVAQLAEAGRAALGNRRFDALIQNSRPNHFTLVETWQDEAALLAHAVAAPTRAFRDALLPISGSLFDERLYRRIE